jgi:hypothetical protein
MINNTTSGHGSNFTNYEGYRVQDDPAAIEKPMEDAVKKLGEYFTVAPVDIKIAPGITLYQDGNLVVANPARPPYWVPATVKEVFEAKMNYYRIRPDDKLVYDFLKSAYEELSAVALYADAYYGSEDGIVNINSTGTGPQIMKFNKAYYDRSLPKTAIQLLSFHWSYADENAFAEFIKNNNHPDYVGLFKNGIDLKELAALIEKGN